MWRSPSAPYSAVSRWRVALGPDARAVPDTPVRHGNGPLGASTVGRAPGVRAAGPGAAQRRTGGRRRGACPSVGSPSALRPSNGEAPGRTGRSPSPTPQWPGRPCRPGHFVGDTANEPSSRALPFGAQRRWRAHRRPPSQRRHPVRLCPRPHPSARTPPPPLPTVTRATVLPCRTGRSRAHCSAPPPGATKRHVIPPSTAQRASATFHGVARRCRTTMRITSPAAPWRSGRPQPAIRPLRSSGRIVAASRSRPAQPSPRPRHLRRGTHLITAPCGRAPRHDGHVVPFGSSPTLAPPAHPRGRTPDRSSPRRSRLTRPRLIPAPERHRAAFGPTGSNRHFGHRSPAGDEPFERPPPAHPADVATTARALNSDMVPVPAHGERGLSAELAHGGTTPRPARPEAIGDLVCAPSSWDRPASIAAAGGAA